MTKVEKEKNLKKNNGKVNDSKENKVLNNIKKFFNNPLPMLIVLTAIIVVLLLYIMKHGQESKIFVGKIIKDDVQVVNVHYFANNDMNYFYASNAAYLGENKKIYSYQIGYYAVSEDGEFYELATRSDKLDKASPIKDIVAENSGWSIGELADKDYFFDSDVLHNIENIHFVILASTDKEKPNDPDITVDYQVELTKLTK